MNKLLLLLIGIVLVAAFTGCASKRFAKKAQKLDQAGYYRDAAQLYYQSVAANRNNIDARMGLQRNGQLLLQDKIDQFKSYYSANAVKDAVYAWLDAEGYHRQVAGVGVDLVFPLQLKGNYEVVKEKYLSARYIEGTKALGLEDFLNAEMIFNEIINIEPAYKDCQTLWTTARYEPMYRTGIDRYNNQLYRSAWMLFNTIVMETNGYKDALTRREEALTKAQITIAVAPFMYSRNIHSENVQSLRNATINGINRMQTPFYKIVPDNLITNMPFDGLGGRFLLMPGWIKEQNRVIKAQAVLVTQVQKFQQISGNGTPVRRPGYLKGTEEYVDESGVKRTRTKYDKVYYHEYQNRNAVDVQVEFALIEVRTGNILVTDVVSINLDDQAVYAAYDGDVKRLVPGYWKHKDRASSDDAIYDSSDKISQLNQLMKAKRDVVPMQTLTGDAINQVSMAIAAAIERYDPER